MTSTNDTNYAPIKEPDKIFITKLLTSVTTSYDSCSPLKLHEFKYDYEAGRFMTLFNLFSRIIIDEATPYTKDDEDEKTFYFDNSVNCKYRKFIAAICKSMDEKEDIDKVLYDKKYRWFVADAVANMLKCDNWLIDYITSPDKSICKLGSRDFVLLKIGNKKIPLSDECRPMFSKKAVKFASFLGLGKYELTFLYLFRKEFDEVGDIFPSSIKNIEEYNKIIDTLPVFYGVDESTVFTEHEVEINGTTIKFRLPDVNYLKKWIKMREDVINIKRGVFNSTRAFEQRIAGHRVINPEDISAYDRSGWEFVEYAKRLADTMCKSKLTAFDDGASINKAKSAILSIIDGNPSRTQKLRLPGTRLYREFINKFIDKLICTESCKDTVLNCIPRVHISDNIKDPVSYYVPLYDYDCNPIVDEKMTLADMAAGISDDMYRFMFDHNLNKYDMTWIFFILRSETVNTKSIISKNEPYKAILHGVNHNRDIFINSGMNPDWSTVFATVGTVKGLELLDAIRISGKPLNLTSNLSVNK